MTQVHTDLGNTRESARRIRFEPTGSITATNVQKAVEQGGGGGGAIVGTNVAVTPYNVLPTDTVLYVDTSIGAVTINLGSAADRTGIPLSVKDVTGHAAANNISLVPSGIETVDGLAPYLINMDFGGVRLYPRTGSFTVAP